MTIRVSVCLAFASLAAITGFRYVEGTSNARAAENVIAISTASMASRVTGYEEANYVGSRKCRQCHLKQHKSWKSSKHGAALTVLEPGQASDLKSKLGLDSAKDYTKDGACLMCHTVGFGKPGGYVIAEDAATARNTMSLAGVGCEACHGPGSGYIELHKEIRKSKRTYKVEEMHAAGLARIDGSVCLKCHNEKSPTFDATAPFDFEKAVDAGVHERHPLLQRE